MTEITAELNALGYLESEHRFLSRLLDALSGYATQLEKDATSGPADLLAFAQVLGGFADMGHHFKEEEILLPALVRHGISWQADSLARIRHDHRQSRYLIEVLEQAANQADAWSREDRRQVIATIRGLVDLERAHMGFENLHLFPAIIERLGPADLDVVNERFQESDARFGSENHARLAELAEELIGRYGSGT